MQRLCANPMSLIAILANVNDTRPMRFERQNLWNLSVKVVGICLTLLPSSASAAKAGTMEKPPLDRAAWECPATKLRFPLTLSHSSYQLTGILRLADTGNDVMLYYDNAQDKARAEILIVRADPVPTDAKSTLNSIEDFLATAVQKMQDGLEEVRDLGRFEGDIPQWKKDAVVLRAHELGAMIHVEQDGKKVRRAVRVWFGTFFLSDYLITIRHQSDEEKVEEKRKRFLDDFFRLVRDLPLREEVQPALEAYIADPLSEAGGRAATVVLTYLQNSPNVATLRPSPPVTRWAEEVEAKQPGAGTHLLRAFVLGGAKAALQQQTFDQTLAVASAQMLRVYVTMRTSEPGIEHPGLEDLLRATERGEVVTWLRAEMLKAVRAGQAD